jgi:predicted N-acetyltransferase YhbS
VSEEGRTVVLAEERAEHGQAIEGLLDSAFGEARWHKTCQRLRDGQSPIGGLSLVALERDKLVGSVRLWPVKAGRKRALLLGPLAVQAAWRKLGLGARLMREAIKRATAAGEEAVILVGDAAYYKRFGFTQSLTNGLWLPGPVERKRFLARNLRRGALDRASGPVMPIAA